MLVAVELYLERDHQAEFRAWDTRIEAIGSRLRALQGVMVERFVPRIANAIPHLRIRWDERIISISPSDVVEQLREGDPSVEVVPVPDR
jgi:L-seryl-tRNA(Ser) seleniumtransferase